MSSTVIGVFVLVTIAVFVWFIWRVTHPHEPAEPRDSADVLAPVERGPRSGAGAVVLDEPEENEPPDSIGRKL